MPATRDGAAAGRAARCAGGDIAPAGTNGISAAVAGVVHRSAAGNAATRTGGTAYGNSGIASIATVIDAHTAWRTPGARVLVSASTIAASAAAPTARTDASARTLHSRRADSVDICSPVPRRT